MSSEPPKDPRETPVEDWLSQLHDGDSPGASDEARELAAVIRRRAADDAAAVDRAGLDSAAAEERALQQLRFRLRREGVDFKARAPARWWAAGAAAMLFIAVAATLYRPQVNDPWTAYDGEPPTFRGGAAIEQPSQDPRGDARALAGRLHAAGVSPIVYLQADRVTVSFALRPEQLAAIEQSVLAPLRLAGAREGENQVVFVQGRP